MDRENFFCSLCGTIYKDGERHACTSMVHGAPHDPSRDPAWKPTNPKDGIGVLKWALSYVPLPVLGEMAIGMMEGGHKYGRHNYRVIGVRASIYFDATIRHLFSWFEGEDTDPDSKAALNHISKAITSLTVLRDAMIRGNWVDDRPPKTDPKLFQMLSDMSKALDKQFPDKVPYYTQERHGSVVGDTNS